MPLSMPPPTRKTDRAPAPARRALPPHPVARALTAPFRHRSYVLLVLGFFTCGFQLVFITDRVAAYLKDDGLSAAVGGWTLAVIGLANAFGSLGSGWLSSRM